MIRLIFPRIVRSTSGGPARAVASLLILTCLLLAGPSSALAQQPAPKPPAADAPGKFTLGNGDRVLFLGNTFIEREQQYGYIELALAMRLPDRNITYRNLGWSGDDVRGTSRGRFGGQPEGWRHLVDSVRRENPTVIFVSYGHADAHAGESGLPEFIDGYAKLIDTLKATNARIVILSPFKYEKMPSPLPDPAAYNQKLGLYVQAIGKLAAQKQCRFVNLYEKLPTRDQAQSDRPYLTDNSIHLTSYGYYIAGQIIASDLLGPGPLLPASIKSDARFSPSPKVEELRTAILKKNELFFHRYRPQNETYLFLFRKHEQGNNAVEMPMFDPLIVEQEKLIASLRSPAAEHYLSLIPR